MDNAMTKKSVSYIGIAVAVFVGVVAARALFFFGAAYIARESIEELGARAQDQMRTMGKLPAPDIEVLHVESPDETRFASFGRRRDHYV